ncbi:unnamed protein product [Closterium sp. NIES-64]|nr:unnamed protein product [Closterium sp. NIES-64]
MRQMVISEEWEAVAVAKQDEGKAVRFLLLDEVFWDCATAVLHIMQPVYDVLRVVDTRALVMGQVYGLMLEATVKTNEAAEARAAMLVKRTSLLAAKDRALFLAEIKAVIAKRWDGQLHNPLHALGWLLNPRNQYVGKVRNDKKVRSGAEAVIQACGGDVALRTLLQAQLAQFHKGEGRLGSPDARWAAMIGKRKKKVGESSKWKRKGKATKPCKGKGNAVAAREEEEAADSSGQEEEDVPTTRIRQGEDPWDISDGSSGEEADDDDDDDDDDEEEEEEEEEDDDE